MPVSESQKKARDKYDKEHFEYISLKVRKGRKEEIKSIAEAQGDSLNGFINKAIDERMERIQADYDKLSDSKKFYRSEEGREAIKNLTKK